MRYRKLVTLGISIGIAGFLSTAAQANKIYPAEIMGRDLNYRGLVWLSVKMR